MVCFLLLEGRGHDAVKDGRQPNNQVDFAIGVLLEIDVRLKKIHRVNLDERFWLIIITGILQSAHGAETAKGNPIPKCWFHSPGEPAKTSA